MKAIADNKELHAEIKKVKTIVVQVSGVNANKPTKHSDHPLNETPVWISEYNAWKAKQ